MSIPPLRHRLAVLTVSVALLVLALGGPIAARATYTDDFTGAAANLTTPWWQWRSTQSVKRDGAGICISVTGNQDGGAVYNDTVGTNQRTKVTVGYTGPANGTKYLYLTLNNNQQFSYDVGGSYYLFWTDGGSDSQVYKVTNGAGTATLLKTDNSLTFSSGDTLEFEVIAGVLKIYKNGTLFSGLTVTDGTPFTGGKPGFGLWGGTPATNILDWEGGDAGGAPPTSVPRLLLQGIG